jgi:hypothetical protein
MSWVRAGGEGQACTPLTSCWCWTHDSYYKLEITEYGIEMALEAPLRRLLYSQTLTATADMTTDNCSLQF